MPEALFGVGQFLTSGFGGLNNTGKKIELISYGGCPRLCYVEVDVGGSSPPGKGYIDS